MTEAHHSHEQCLALFARMSEYLDNELDEATYRLIQRHLSDCPACNTCLSMLKRTTELYRTATGTIEVPRHLSARLMALCDNLTR